MIVAGVGLAAAGTMLAGAAPAPANGAVAPDTVGLWDPDHGAQQTAAECEGWRLDERAFCTADDRRNGVQLGMKFQASRTLVVTGIRIYRVDLGTVTGSLWDSDGTRLATGTFDPSDTTGWQDLTFSGPVTISPGRTYVVSYYSPATKYAFDYALFQRQQLVRGPVTALRAVAGDPNGVHCYDTSQQCETFPKSAYKDSSYWVTPLWRTATGEPGATQPQPPPLPPAAATAPGTLPDDTAPSVRTARPTRGAKRVGRRTSVTITFSEQVRSAMLTTRTVRLQQKGRRKAVPVRLRYDERRHRLTVDPVRRLKPRTTYLIVIRSRVVDIAGNRLDQDPRRSGSQRATWRFRTR